MPDPRVDRPQWQTAQVYYPEPYLPNHAGVRSRDIAVSLVNGIAGTESLVPKVSFTIPGSVYALTGSAMDTTGADWPTGMNPLDTFLVRFAYAFGDRFTSEPTLASNVLGRAGLPRLVGGHGWEMNQNGQILVAITPLRANLRISVCLWFIEFRGMQKPGERK